MHPLPGAPRRPRAVAARSAVARTAVARTAVARTAVALLAVAACADDRRSRASDPTPPTEPRAQIATTAPLRWSDPAAWPGGRVPAAGDSVRIAAGRTVLLDGATAPLRSLTIEGALVADRTRDVAITAGWIMVHGTGARLEIGTEAEPFARRAVVTLTGAPSAADVMGMGTKVLGVMAGGALELHGARARAVSWTRLAADAPAGATSLTLAEPVDWRPGDRLVLAPSGTDPLQAEVVTVTANGGTSLTVAPALRFPHLGTVQTIEGRAVDMRAEVGLLTRDLVVRGDESSAATRFGGHVMVMGAGSRARVQGVEFRDMGQEARAGRYAFHWHFAGAAAGQYVRNSSIHRTFTRGVVVHGTRGARIERVVGHESHSHMFVGSEDLEDEGNVLRGNLAVLVRRHADPARRIQHVDDDGTTGPHMDQAQDEHRPSGFWFQNPNQIVEGNVAAGATDGNGFHFDDGIHEEAAARLVFRDNVAHSNRMPYTGGNDRYPPDTHGFGLFVANLDFGDAVVPRTWTFERFTAYKNTLGGAWLESDGTVLRDAVLADNGTGAVVFRSRIERALVVGQSANRLGGLAEVGTSWAGGIHVMAGQGPDKRPIVRDVTFVDQRDAAFVFLERVTDIGTAVRGVRRVRTPSFLHDLEWSGFVHDEDGTLTGSGVPGLLLADRSRLALGPSCARVAAAQPLWVWRCPTGTPLGMLRLLARSGRFGNPTTALRDDGATKTLEGEASHAERTEWVTAGRDYALRYGVATPPSVVYVSLWQWSGTGSVTVAVPAAPTARVFHARGGREDERPDPNAPLALAPTREAALATNGTAYWRDPATGRLHLRLMGGGRGVFVCATACR